MKWNWNITLPSQESVSGRGGKELKKLSSRRGAPNLLQRQSKDHEGRHGWVPGWDRKPNRKAEQVDLKRFGEKFVVYNKTGTRVGVPYFRAKYYHSSIGTTITWRQLKIRHQQNKWSDVTSWRRQWNPKTSVLASKRPQRHKYWATPGCHKIPSPEWVSHLSGLKKPSRRGLKESDNQKTASTNNMMQRELCPECAARGNVGQTCKTQAGFCTHKHTCETGKGKGEDARQNDQ